VSAGGHAAWAVAAGRAVAARILHEVMKYLPYVLFVAALGAAFGYSKTADPSLQRLAAGGFAILLGSAILLWGVSELRSGCALVIHRTVLREEKPFVYWSVLLVFRLVLGLVLLSAGLWHLVTGSG